MSRVILSCLILPAFVFCQLDTSALNDNQWVNFWPATSPLTISGNNWAYENDFGSHPFYGFFIMGPGHVIHPQDNKFYPYDPVRNKWTILNPPFRSPRDCMSSFSVSSQDTAILHFSGSEGGHQLSNGFFTTDYKTIAHEGVLDVILTAYKFNSNRLYWMKGPAFVRNGCCQMMPRYDPVHDVTYMLKGSDIWLYSFHNNKCVRFGNGSYAFTGYLWAVTADTRRGRCIVFDAAAGRTCFFNPENGTWAQVSGSNPPGSSGTPGIANIAYDDLHDVVVCLAGGGQTWALNCQTMTWSQVSASNTPPGRGHLAFNPALNLFMSLGGSSNDISRGGTTQGCWAYRYSSTPTAYDNLAAAPPASINLSDGTVKLSWQRSAESGVTGYNVYRANADPFPRGFAKLNSSPVADTFYTDASAAQGTGYSYRICAVKAGVEGHLSRHLYTRPGRPMGPAASVESANLVKVSWEQNPEPDISGYHVYRAVAAGIYDTSFRSYTKLTSAPVAGTEYNDNVDLSDGIVRGYVVTAVNRFGNESGWSAAATTFPGPCEWTWALGQSTPQGLKMALRWQPPARTRILGVNLYRCTTPPEKQNASGLITDTSATLWTMPPSTGGTGAELMAQTYVVRAVNALNQEGFLTDQFSPSNTEYGYGIATPAVRFDYSLYYKGPGVGSELSGVKAAQSGALCVWPNPFNPAINVSFNPVAGRAARLSIYDTNGRLVRAKKLRGDTEKIVLPGLAQGVYLIRVQCGKERLETRAVCLR